MTLYEALLYLRKYGPVNSWYGICENLAIVPGFNVTREEAICAVGRLASTWAEHTGCDAYPVPHPTLDPEDAYYAATNLWDQNTPYGQARYRLLDYLIERAEEEEKGALNSQNRDPAPSKLYRPVHGGFPG